MVFGCAQATPRSSCCSGMLSIPRLRLLTLSIRTLQIASEPFYFYTANLQTTFIACTGLHSHGGAPSSCIVTGLKQNLHATTAAIIAAGDSSSWIWMVLSCDFEGRDIVRNPHLLLENEKDLDTGMCFASCRVDVAQMGQPWTSSDRQACPSESTCDSSDSRV